MCVINRLSPPLTATYISNVLHESDGTRQTKHVAASDKHEIHTTRKQLTVICNAPAEISRQRPRRNRYASIDTGALQGERRSIRQAINTNHNRRRAVGIGKTTLGKCAERRQLAGAPTKANAASSEAVVSGAPV